MISEDHLERLALTWFQDVGWECHHGPGIAPDGDGCEFGKVLGAMKAEEK